MLPLPSSCAFIVALCIRFCLHLELLQVFWPLLAGEAGPDFGKGG